jgi:preprotein translocase subunit SecE
MNWLRKVRTFLAEVRSELKRTTFPSGKEVRGTTTVVIVTVFIFALFLFVVDAFLSWFVDRVFEIAG